MISLPANISSIAIKMSGGADSSLAAYLIADYINKNNLKIKVFPVVIIEEDAPFQYEISSKCITIIEQLTNIKFEPSLVYYHYSKNNKIQCIREIEKSLTEIDLIVSGTSQYPKDSEFFEPGGPDDHRVGYFPTLWDNRIYTPLVNLDKKEIAELYKKNNLMNNLFVNTRSCVAVTTDFSKHCGQCWWCKERIYGFGKL